jgi:DNA-binding CsgD family transcriptional regulator/tetratricopeptide (TPR) repeat protein
VAVLAGRSEELTVLEDAIDFAHRGAGRLVLICGEAGIGKTGLADTAAQLAAARGMLMVKGYAVDDPGAPPMWPWVRAFQAMAELRSILDRRIADDADPSARFRMFVEITTRLRELSMPDGMFLLLEDLHWADRSSVLLLRHLVAELADCRLVLVATFREESAGHLSTVVPDLLRSRSHRVVRLGGLDASAIADWMRSMPELAAWSGAARLLESRTDGNPLLIRLVAEALPANADAMAVDRLLTERADLRALVMKRLDALSNPARRLMATASVLAERIQPDLLSRLTGHTIQQTEACLREAVDSGVLQNRPAGLSFTHALVRDAVYAQLLPWDRADLHVRVANALAQLGQPELAGPIATHWRRADRPRECVDWARRAAVQAHSILAYDEAASFAELAMEQAQACGAVGAELAEIAVELARARFAAEQVPESIDACVLAADLAEAAARPDLLAEAALVIHGIGSIDVYRVIRGLCDRALAQLPAHDSVIRARLLAQIAVAAAEDEAGPVAQVLSARALAAAEASGDPTAILEAIAARHLSITVPQTVHERLELANRAIELGSRSNSPMAELWGHLWRLEASLQLGDLVDFDRELAVVDRIGRARQSPIARWHWERLSATRSALVGNFEEALIHNENAKRLSEKMRDLSTTGMYFAFLNAVAMITGDPSAQSQLTPEYLNSLPPLPVVRITWPIVLAMRGERDAAVAAFEEFRSLPATFPVGTLWAATIGQIGLTAILLDDAEVAAQVYELLLPLAGYCTGDGSGAVISYGSNSLNLGDLALTVGRFDDALRHYADAIAVDIRIGARPFVALARFGWASALIARNTTPSASDLKEANKLLRNCVGEFRRLGMPGPLACAENLQKQVNARQPVNPLSRRESEVAVLVAQSLSNREIAERLFLSERTVESHVRAILAKMDFNGRTEIATWVVRSG